IKSDRPTTCCDSIVCSTLAVVAARDFMGKADGCCTFEEWVGRAGFCKPGEAERCSPRLAQCYGQSLSSVIRGKSALTALKSGSSAVTPGKLNFSARATKRAS